ncbi:GPR1/FUN34/yaaH family protein [Colletotrichum paranaense]|uniref:GPR1/FUN34/yaaH family protein n=8 Tax=Colletotrichum acutatum species complex TaxID=2707335 RepID=A0A9P7U5F3_9PEZI|nr:GPR1/FUN34/yaaH family protein [Colletotrichum costaricense]XP_060356029.1 GPR1/FUN34/yaaH family protein [Colletotrichum paranaense]XP_060402699.1 GPR1/FUN34/yaaH family protein [Colletotrichum abscissum]KAG7038049.1 GPR1/FUN34/yaaH family protein [Colletotrichum scovillei]KAI3539422.1 GPR1/FUN34/yaaH family protein [Colletotrichum filicis]KAK0376642.1 GPR1/FUN34/yaaH family protein [Colletotrichum limetticola]KAK1455608.1 GPR1/FUN34/yaaH family protein [Colletotrichum melonis]KAK1705818
MATHEAHHNAVPPQDVEKDVHTSGADHYNGANGAQVGQNTYSRQAGPFSRVADYRNMTEGEAQAFGGSLQPGVWKPYEHRKFANPAPLGLSAFALTTFVLSCVNLHARGVTAPNIAVPLAFGYGGLVQLLAGMWEMAVGNTFGATALSSYGGFWIAYGILLTPNWGIIAADGPYAANYSDHYSAVGFFLTGWFIFTTLLLLCTLRSTVVFFSLFFTLDLAFLFLACENYAANNGALTASRNLQICGGTFGMLAAFLAWYCALAGLQDDSNSFFQVPVFHLPWSDKGKEIRRAKSNVA